ncbi:MAG: rod shape-determining protein RodA [Flavobacteriales bacterium]|tara:strand:+ start:8946 stop:10226 length:1281 start_codon:yes stop_codon:yes gene_type:complete
MIGERKNVFKVDKVLVVLYILLVGFGWGNILSSSLTGEVDSIFNIGELYGKQLVFILLSSVIILITLSIEAKFYERFASVFYLLAILSLIGLFIFGKTVNGSTSWYGIGAFTIQPSEFAKVATALAVAKFISDFQTNIKLVNHQLKLLVMIFLPALLIILQNDTGSTLVYSAFFFVLFREGVPKIYLYAIGAVFLLFVSTIKFSMLTTFIILSIIIFLVYIKKRKKRYSVIKHLGVLIICTMFSFSINYFFNNVIKQHQKNRISLWLKLENNPDEIQKMKRTILYNLNESEKAISSGGWNGKGYLEGTRTIGKFVPEQQTDYIFSTVGEEWGFIGSSFIIILFVLLLLRILHLSELQKNKFSRVYGYSVVSIIFFHFMVNIGMVMGLVPTIGIPLPFFSYGGSSLWAFTILLFIFIKLDSNKLNEW